MNKRRTHAYCPTCAEESASEQRFRTIVADPPWRLDRVSATKANAERFYPTMSTEAISALDVAALAADDAHLWLWGLNSMLDAAYDVARAWGFQPITLVTWCKSGPGVGHYLRNNTEHCLLASRGKPMTPEDKPLSTWYVWPRGAHSAKPDAFYDLVEQVSPGPYLELFARRARFGWEYAGNESLSTVHVEGLAA